MILIIAGTDRINSKTRRLANHVQALVESNGEKAEVLDLSELKPASHNGPHYGGSELAPEVLSMAIRKVGSADGLYLCIPEYNGSMPGALKYFIDHWKFPESFEFRPMAFCGLGGMWGGLRSVEHVQGVMGYRNAFMYPERVFVRDVWTHLDENGALKDPLLTKLFATQVSGFVAFMKALKAAGLDANSRLSLKQS